MPGRSNPRTWRAVTASTLALFALGALSASASALAEGPGWMLTARTYPTNLRSNGRGTIEIDVFNIGAAAANAIAHPITVTDTLPPGVTATDAGELLSKRNGIEPQINHELWNCTGNGPGEAPRIVGASVVSCTSTPEKMPVFEGGGGLPNRAARPNLQPEVAIAVRALPGAGEAETNRVAIAGGGAPTTASIEDTIRVSDLPPPFGVVGFDAWFSNADGTLDTQAGSHPYEATFSIDLANAIAQGGEQGNLKVAGGEARNFVVDLPPGLVGDPTAVPQCTNAEFDAYECPDASQVGSVLVRTAQFPAEIKFRVFNLVPPPGAPAEIGFPLEGINTRIDFGVRAGDNGITARIADAAQEEIVGSVLMIWGVPGERSHDPWRSPEQGGCSPEQIEQEATECFSSGRRALGGEFRGPILQPFLTLPTACEGPQSFSIEARSWGGPSTVSKMSFLSHDGNGDPLGFTGCEDLSFGPSLSVAPDTSQADTPAGLTAEISPPLGGLLDRVGLGSADLRGATVTLPEGLAVNPGQAAGLAACQASEAGLGAEGPPSCPPASRIGDVRVQSPLLEGAAEKELEGGVYLLASNPPDLKLLVAASGDGVNVKVAGDVRLDETTGRLTATFPSLPQLPFSRFKLTFDSGPHAPLVTPGTCGAYTTTSDLVAWSSPLTADVFPSSGFEVQSGVGGASCPSLPLPFSPSVAAGSESNQAGGFTPFLLHLARDDGQQRLAGLSLTLPRGLLAMIGSVPLCGEPQASQGACAAASQIGHLVSSAGAGSYPLVVPQPGNPQAEVYLTGPYRGAPFGLSIVVPAIAGPFDLGNVIVRSRILVDPHTAQPTIVTDAFPTILDGVPLDLRSADIAINRQGFTFNPTNCKPMSITGTVAGTEGSLVSVSSRFQAVNCTTLGFHPVFTVSTQAKTSKKNGASLDVKVTSSTGQANIGKVAVSLPKQLPSRLTTIQQACPAAVFAANPASCPAGSDIGTATASTPVLAGPVTGPAYLVSHGGAAFPDLVLILQGEGITLDLTGSIDIKHGVTSSAFNSVPDAPIDSFELSLPEGPHSGLAAVVLAKAKGSLCGQSLTMPTTVTGQNGAVIKQSTKIKVTGCPKPRKKTGHKRRGRKK
jgi:hypothetical protein